MIPQPPELAGLPKTCVHGTTLAHGEYVVENNDWGAGGVAHTQCIYAAAASSASPLFGWTWDYPSPTGGVLGFPEVVFGKKPFSSGASTTTKLPRTLNPLSSIRADFAIRTLARGAINSAFEIWLTRSSAAAQADITHEVMFWIGSQRGIQPAGSIAISGLALGDGRTCDLWIARPGDDGWTQPWTYFAFVFHNAFSSGVLQFDLYLQELLRQGLIPSTAFIADLELGNEVWDGEGYTIVDRYDVAVA